MSIDPEAAKASPRRGVHFDPTINLGHILTAATFLIATVAAWTNMDARVAQLSKDFVRVESSVPPAISRIEVEFTRRMTEQRQYVDQTQVRTADDIREMKTMMRDGFRDLDSKLDKKADKPAGR